MQIFRSMSIVSLLLFAGCDSETNTSDRSLTESGLHSVPANFDDGHIVSKSGYADMAYLIEYRGSLFATLTTGNEEEGSESQHVKLYESKDNGENWTIKSIIESPDGPEASWAMPFLAGDDLGVIYTYNTQNIRGWPMSNGKSRGRVDSLGDFAFRFSSDFGQSWSDREVLDVPISDIDYRNGFEGKETVFWLSGMPIQNSGKTILGLSKAGVSHPKNIFPDTEAFILSSSNPADVTSWELLPKGTGLTAPDGSKVSEEPSVAFLPNGSLYAVYRTNSGKLAKAISSDNGRTWDSDWVKLFGVVAARHPRAKAVVKQVRENQFVLWFHNNNTRGFRDRNPVWMSCGTARGGDILWGDPDIILYHPSTEMRMSYPSMVVQDDTLLISATNKSEARVFKFQLDDICD